MDIFSMLQNVTILDLDGDAIAHGIGFEIIDGRMRITAVPIGDHDEDDDPDDGDKEEIPEDFVVRHLNVVGSSETVPVKGKAPSDGV